MKKVLLIVISILFGSVLVGCQMNESNKTQDKIQSITGSVAYRERIALPDNAVVTVYLQDVSLADAPATVIAKQNFITNGMQVHLSST